MRILQVCPRYPPQTGGVETHVSEICERLVDRGHQVTVHTADAGGGGKRRGNRRGVEVRRHRGLAPGGAIHVAPAIVGAVRRASADVIHAHNYHSLPLLFAAFGVTDERFVATTHYHGASPNRTRDLLLAAYRPVGRHILDRADVVIAVSDWERSQLVTDFSVDATVIPNGLNARRFARADPEERELPYLLSVGRLERYKGVQYAIRALPHLKGFELVVAGSGSYGSRLRSIAKNSGVSDRVAFLGTVEDSRLPSLYSGASACLVLSSFEAYGMTVAEALASGTPCIVRNRMALSDWSSTPGVFGIDSVEPMSVAETVRKALAEETIDVELPTWDDHVTQLVACYGQPDGKA